ncbi:MAG: DUF4003 family protein [Clostridiales bacterium]|nr:DUF4003 family protein [Clostridiales bacterium]
MKEQTQNICDVFISNYKTAGDVFRLDGDMGAVICASTLIGTKEPVDENILKKLKVTIDSSSGFFSTLRNSKAKQAVVAAASKTENPDEAYLKIEYIHKLLKTVFRDSSDLVITAVGLFQFGKNDDIDTIIKRTRRIYDLIDIEHPVITTSEDILNFACMASSGKSAEDCAKEFEAIFKEVCKYVKKINEAQALACILSVFDGECETKVKNSCELYDYLRKHRISFDNFGLELVGIIAMLFEDCDKDLLVEEIKEVSSYLSKTKGLGSWGGVGEKVRNMISASIVIDSYLGDNNAISMTVKQIISTVITRTLEDYYSLD